MSINLSKGQQISLSKSDGTILTAVRMSLGWQAAPRKGFLAKLTAREIDLDASALLFASGQISDVVFFQQLTSKDGSVRHTGDNLTGGAGDGGDDESILVDLARVPAHADQIRPPAPGRAVPDAGRSPSTSGRWGGREAGAWSPRWTAGGDGRGPASFGFHRRSPPGSSAEDSGPSVGPGPAGWRPGVVAGPSHTWTVPDVAVWGRSGTPLARSTSRTSRIRGKTS